MMQKALVPVYVVRFQGDACHRCSFLWCCPSLFFVTVMLTRLSAWLDDLSACSVATQHVLKVCEVCMLAINDGRSKYSA